MAGSVCEQEQTPAFSLPIQLQRFTPAPTDVPGPYTKFDDTPGMFRASGRVDCSRAMPGLPASWLWPDEAGAEAFGSCMQNFLYDLLKVQVKHRRIAACFFNTKCDIMLHASGAKESIENKDCLKWSCMALFTRLHH